MNAATTLEREAVAAWLASSLNKPESARAQWNTGAIALLALGRRFSAIRLSDQLVYAVSRTELPEQVARVLAAALQGPVIHDPQGRRFYALVPPTEPTGHLGEHAAYLGMGTFLGTPRVDDTEPSDATFCYWSVPVSRPGDVCDPIRVAALIAAGTAELRRSAEA